MSTAKKITAAKKSGAAKKATSKLAEKLVPIVTHYSNSEPTHDEAYVRSFMLADGYIVLDTSQNIVDEFPTLEAYDAALKNDDFEIGTAHYLYRITPVKIVVVKD